MNARKATCFTVEDQQMIHGSIERLVGYARMNELLLGALKRWATTAGHEAIGRLPEAEHGVSNLLNEVARMHHQLGEHQAAEALYRQQIAASEAKLGRAHPRPIVSRINLADLKQAQGDLRGSAAQYREILHDVRASQAQLGWEESAETTEMILSAMHNLGHVLQRAGELQEAAAVLGEAMASSLTHSAKKDLMNSLAVTYASVLQAQGKHQEAGSILLEVIHSWRRVKGSNDPALVIATCNLGASLQQQGDLQGARRLLGEALEASRESLGANHAQTLTCLSNYAGVLKDLGETQRAFALFREELEACRKLLGAAHPDTITSLQNLGTILKQQGDLDGAEQMLRDALQQARAGLGARHPITIVATYNLGGLERARGKLGASWSLVDEAARLALQVLGSEHPHTRRILEVLAEIEAETVESA